jgi:hypothetical protein
MIAYNPLHRSGQGELPHPAPTLGEDAQTHEGIRMTNPGRWESARYQAPHSLPWQVIALTTSTQDRVPQATDGHMKCAQRRSVHPNPSALNCSYLNLYSLALFQHALSTLRRHPHGQLRMTRGRCGSLDLRRMKLSSTTPCRINRRTETE